METHNHTDVMHIEEEMLNQQPGEQAPAARSRSGTIILGFALAFVSVSVFLFFLFMFRPLCVQMDMPPLTDDGKVNFTSRIQDTKGKSFYEIFQAEKAGNYSIHGWLKRNTIANETVELVQKINAKQRCLEKKSSSGLLYFSTKAFLINGSRVHLQFHSLLDTDGFFYIYEL